MSSSVKNLYQFRTTTKITQGQGATSTFDIGNDIFTNTAVTITAGSVKLENRTGSQVELMTLTATGWTATIATRGILPDWTTSTSYQYERPRNTLCTVTILENQLANKVDTNTFTEDQAIESGNKLKLGSNAYVWTENNGTDLKFKDASNSEKTLTQLASASGSNDKVKISATDTTEWFLNAKITAGDWLSKSITNPAWNEEIDLDIDLTDTTKFSESWVASRAVVTDSSGNIFQATTLARWGAKAASDAVVATWTNQTDYTNPLQLRTNSKTVSWTTTRVTSDSTGSQTIAHWLGIAPRMVQFQYMQTTSIWAWNAVWIWSYDWTTNRSIGIYDAGAVADYRVWSTLCIERTNASWVGRTASATVDATNITLSWTKWGAWLDIWVLWTAHA